MASSIRESVHRPTAVDLYAGAGGLSLGIEQAGFDVAAAVELEPVHALVHRFNFPNTPVMCTDALKTNGLDILASARAAGPISSIDAVVGGPPCQGFSAGGVRNAADDRNNQLMRFVDLVLDLKPRVFCLENVAGLLESRFDGLREQAFRRLEAGGYALSGTDSYIDAQDYGVPQSRKRVIVLGGLDGAPKLLPPAGVSRINVGDALEGLPDLSAYRELLRTDAAQLKPDDLATRSASKSPYARALAELAEDATNFAHARIWDEQLLTSSLRTVHQPKTIARFRRTAPGTVEPRSHLYRLDPERLARTLRAGTGADRGSHTSPRPIHPTKNRVITVREAARLHGYPDWFRFNSTNWHGHRQVGNSVPPPLAKAIGAALMEALGYTPTKPRSKLELTNPEWLRMGSKASDAILRRLV